MYGDDEDIHTLYCIDDDDDDVIVVVDDDDNVDGDYNGDVIVLIIIEEFYGPLMEVIIRLF